MRANRDATVANTGGSGTFNIYRASTEHLLILNIYRTYTSIEDLLNIYRNDRTSIDHRSSIYQTSTEHLSGGKIASKLPPSD